MAFTRRQHGRSLTAAQAVSSKSLRLISARRISLGAARIPQKLASRDRCPVG